MMSLQNDENVLCLVFEMKCSFLIIPGCVVEILKVEFVFTKLLPTVLKLTALRNAMAFLFRQRMEALAITTWEDMTISRKKYPKTKYKKIVIQ